MNILTLSLLATLFFTFLGCGKKVTDPGPQFDLKTTYLNATEVDEANYVITRDDENSGPRYNIESSDISSIDYIDKKLICGPLIIPAKRSLKNENTMTSFKVSEAEFHGLNQLPLRPTCTLQVIAANAGSSTLTKNIPLLLVFDKNPNLVISRVLIVKGELSARPEIPLDSYSITNPLPYDVTLIFRPKLEAMAWGEYPVQGLMTQGSYGIAHFTHCSVKIQFSRVQFEPKAPDISGDIMVGFRFKIKAGGSLKVTSWGSLPSEWPMTRQSNLGPISLLSMTFSRTVDSTPSLYQSLDFEPVPQDYNYAQGAKVQSERPIAGLEPYDPKRDPEIYPFLANPNL